MKLSKKAQTAEAKAKIMNYSFIDSSEGIGAEGIEPSSFFFFDPETMSSILKRRMAV